jgi:hypothetical protein
MMTLLIVWTGAFIAFIMLGSQSRYGSAGLPLAYFLNLSLIHVPGALLYPESQSWENLAIFTETGFEQTVIGIVAFLAAVIFARYIGLSRYCGKARVMNELDALALDRLALFYISVGLFFFMSARFLSNIPSMSSVVGSLTSLIIIGVCLRLWVAREMGNGGKWWLTVALLPMIPLLTLVKDGFLSYGTGWLLTIISFLLNQSKRSRISYLFMMPVFFFFALSVFVNYMASRDEYRLMAWRGQAEIGDKVKRIAQIFQNFEWIDYSNPKHREALVRLNQNPLVGMAVKRLESGEVAYASGSTIGTMVLALIPRALWPDKPIVGGGGNVVSEFTGVQFAAGTSVGAGQVLEFYVNFGTWGVIGGFLLWGWVVGRMDLHLVDCVNRGDQRGFLFWFLVGIAMLQPGGNLLEVVVSLATAALAAKGVGHLLNRRFTGASVVTTHSGSVG